MSFFSNIETDGTFEAAPAIEVIPNDTTCVAMLDDAGWTEYQGDEYISLRWNILEPAIYKGRKIFQKVKVYDTDIKKAEKAKRMLVNVEGSLMPGVTAKDIVLAVIGKIGTAGGTGYAIEFGGSAIRG